MAQIGTINIGGRTEDGACTYGFSCELKDAAVSNHLWVSPDQAWSVELRAGEKFAAARCSDRLGPDELLEAALSIVHQAFDVIAVNTNETLSLDKPLRDHFLVFDDQGKCVLRQVVNFRIKVTQSVQIRIKHKDGTETFVDNEPKPIWHPSFRYYRLSQLSSDVYEAYRNLYLAFESVCSDKIKRMENERESEWIRRCFHWLHQNFDLSAYAPAGHGRPAEYLFGVLYEHIRCRLFHAKAGESIVPFLELNQSAVQGAYSKLVKLYRAVCAELLGFSKASAVFTHQGFRVTMEGMFGGDKAGIAVTADKSPLALEDTEVSPTGEQVHDLPAIKYLGETGPGIVCVRGVDEAPTRLPDVSRTGLLSEGKLIAGSHTPGSLKLHGIDRFESFLYMGLVQGNQPKEMF